MAGIHGNKFIDCTRKRGACEQVWASCTIYFSLFLIPTTDVCLWIQLLMSQVVNRKINRLHVNLITLRRIPLRHLSHTHTHTHTHTHRAVPKLITWALVKLESCGCMYPQRDLQLHTQEHSTDKQRAGGRPGKVTQSSKLRMCRVHTQTLLLWAVLALNVMIFTYSLLQNSIKTLLN